MGTPVAIPTNVTNANTQAPINGLVAANFDGLIAAPNQTGQPVTALGNGDYILAFDGSQTSLITCNVNEYAPDTLLWTNQASLDFSIQPQSAPGNFFVRLTSLTPTGKLFAPATVFISFQFSGSGFTSPLATASTNWGDGTVDDVTNLAGDAGIAAHHEYIIPGSYVITYSGALQNGSAASGTVQVSILASPISGIPVSAIQNISATSWTNRVDIFTQGVDPAALYDAFGNGAAPWTWENLGGILVGPPAAVSWGPNRIDIFTQGTDNALYHTYGNGAAPWTWERIGGILTGPPSVVSWGPNRIDIFTRGRRAADGGVVGTQPHRYIHAGCG
jgi:hypothetical protein